jgi:hypothetical protein
MDLLELRIITDLYEAFKVFIMVAHDLFVELDNTQCCCASELG